MTLRHSVLDSRHRAAGAKMVPFGGWEMPLQYPTGTLAEHRACRATAVAFDVSHLGSVVVDGDGAFDRLQRAFTNDLGRIGPGRAQYTHLLDAQDASVLDDIIVWWLDDDSFVVMPNASNTARVIEALGEPSRDVTDDRALIALQGPGARNLLGSVAPDAAAVERFRVSRFSWQGAEAIAAGTGYTGEDGVEVSVPVERAEAFWDAVVDAGFRPAGLGARDTLRLEAGLPLHGHELGPGITPLQAGLGWVVSWDKGPFQGREALAAERDRGVDRKLVGLRVEGRRPPRTDQRIHHGGSDVGVVTSGNFSPTLETGIAFALVDPDLELGEEVAVVAPSGGETPARVVRVPFIGRD